MADATPTPEDRLKIAIDGDTFVLEGDLDPHTSPYLQTTVDDTMSGDDARVVFDMGGVGFVDSAGLRVIADTHRRVSAGGGELVLRAPSSGLQKLLTVTGLADHITVEA